MERDGEDTFDTNECLHITPSARLGGVRKMSEMSENAMHHSKRNQNLVEMREMVMRICNDKSLNAGQLQTLLSDRRFCQILFNLFDERESNLLRQADWFSQMKEWTEVAIGRLTSP